MIRRTFDAAEVNRIANDRSVLPFIAIADSGPLDFGMWLSDAHNVALMTEGGCFLLAWVDGTTYEAHPMFVEGARGPHVLAAAREGLAWMFARDCTEIIAPAPERNRRARALAVRLGMTFRELAVLSNFPFSPFLMFHLTRSEFFKVT